MPTIVINGTGGGGATTFIGLTDVPTSYSGQTGKFPKVNATEDALEFAAIAGGGDLLASNNLSDVANTATALSNLGGVAKSTYNAHTILQATTDDTPTALTITEQTVVGRATGGNIAALAIDSDLASVSASDDTIPSAKATKTALDLKAPLASPTFTGTVTLPVALTGVVRVDSGVVSVDTDVTDTVAAASDTAAGKIEIATTAETNTGTDTGRAVSPDGLAGSVFGEKVIHVLVFEGATAVTTGDGKAYFRVSPSLNGMNIVSVGASLIAAKSTSGTPTVQIARGRQPNATTIHTFADVLSTLVTIDENEWDSKDATTAAVVNASNDDLATGDLLRIDVDVAGTGSQGLCVSITCRLP